MGRPLAAPAAHAEGLVLTEDGAAGPNQKGSVSPPGLAHDGQGMEAAMAETSQRRRLGSRQPDQKGVAEKLVDSIDEANLN